MITQSYRIVIITVAQFLENEMFSNAPNYTKLKTHLRLAVSRLKLLEKKKIEITEKSRKEIADYIRDGKIERAKIRVECIIRY